MCTLHEKIKSSTLKIVTFYYFNNLTVNELYENCKKHLILKYNYFNNNYFLFILYCKDMI